MPKSKFNNATIKPSAVDYGNVNGNRIKFQGKTTAIIEKDRTKQQLELLITTKNTHPLPGLDWMGKLGMTFETDKISPNINHKQTENTIDRIITLKHKFNKVFTDKIEKLKKTRVHRKPRKIAGKCFLSPAVISKKDVSINCTRLAKVKRNNGEKEGTSA